MGLSGAAGLGLRGLTVGLRVLGCRSNLCEGDALAGELEARGARVSRDLRGAGAAVVLTCSVTGEADRKCRQLLRRARRALGDEGILAAAGCWAQGIEPDVARGLGVDILVGTRRRSLLPDAIEAMLHEGRSFLDLRMDLREGQAQVWEELPLKSTGLHTRAFLRVQEGCDHFCSYCVIPFLRGRPVSRPVESVLTEVRRLVQAGCREVVLTGIHLGAWGRDLGTNLAGLVRALSAAYESGSIGGLERLRMGSLEPFSLDGGLLEALADCPVFCPHLHLPLQSGDDDILALMRRGYDGDAFARVCGAARARLGDGLHISSDILVGFPGEDERAFRNTLALMRRAGLGRAHVFPFSERRGTLAERLPGRVEPHVRAERAAEAVALGRELLSRYASRFVGREIEVLTETAHEGCVTGHTPHFLEAVFFENGASSPNTLVRVRVLSESEGRLKGCPV